MKMKETLLNNKKTVLMVVAFLLVAALMPVIITKSYIQAILVLTVYTAGCSLAWSILGGMVGQTSLGHAAFAALGSYVGTIFVVNLNLSPWLAMIVAFFVVGGLITLLMWPCFGLKGTYFTLTTIAFAEAFRNVFTNWKYVGAGQGLMLPLVRKGEESLWMLAFRDKVSYYYVGLLLLLAFYLIVKWIDGSKLGYALKTIREDEDTAQAIGIKPIKYKLIATFISCGMVAVMGVFYASYIRYISPELMLKNKSLEFVLPAVIGGISTVEGPVLGSLIIVPLSQWLNSELGSILPGSNLVVYALILIVVVMFRPAGILGWLQQRQQKKRIAQERIALEGETAEKGA